MLIVAAGKVDGRLPLVKKLAAAGRRVTTALEKEGPWDSQKLVLSPLLETLLAGTGKRVDRGGEVALGERVGEDARVLASEVEKLRAYVGDRKVIGAADVLAVVARVAPDPFFALGNAVEGRDLKEALSVLDRSIADGASPFMLLGSLAGTVRRLLVEQERGRLVAEGRRIVSQKEWMDRVLPTISAKELESRKPYGIWMKYQASLRFTRDELMDALLGLARADLGMKSGQDGRMGIRAGPLRPPRQRESGKERSLSQRILVTSALPYANGPIHLGHLVEYIQTDIYVRFQRSQGALVTYVCAADSHGTPIEVNAAKAGVTPKAFVERWRTDQQKDFQSFEVEFSTFYTTDSEENQRL